MQKGAVEEIRKKHEHKRVTKGNQISSKTTSCVLLQIFVLYKIEERQLHETSHRSELCLGGR